MKQHLNDIKPYYKTELTTIFNCEHLEYLKTLPDNYFDLLLTDPPYGIGESGKKNHSRGCLATTTKFEDFEWDNNIPTEEEFKEMLRVSKKAIIFGGNYFIEYLKNSSCWLVWDKNNGKTDFADCELAWTNFDTAVRKYKFTWQGMLQEDMRFKEKRYHPTQKPLELFYMILQDYSKEDDLILDCYAGSFTTAIVCEQLGKKNVSIEKEKKYCDIGIKRLQNMQLRMEI